jgi:uncharacterized BrkB/YihY/UPF0761 family membrane protein
MEKHLKYSFITLGLLFLLLPVSIVLHNFVSGLLGIEEPIFFFLALFSAFAIPLAFIYVILAGIITVFKKIPRPKRKKK